MLKTDPKKIFSDYTQRGECLAFLGMNAEKYDQLHAKTQQDVKTIKRLTTQIERFLETPMAEHGILSQEGIATLEEVNKVANDYVMELYG